GLAKHAFDRPIRHACNCKGALEKGPSAMDTELGAWSREKGDFFAACSSLSVPALTSCRADRRRRSRPRHRGLSNRQWLEGRRLARDCRPPNASEFDNENCRAVLPSELVLVRELVRPRTRLGQPRSGAAQSLPKMLSWLPRVHREPRCESSSQTADSPVLRD